MGHPTNLSVVVVVALLALLLLFLLPCCDDSTETYHMIDTCDPSVACWSEDGETFVVKDPIKFEKQIIPQFFKHSKFSSFVRVSTGNDLALDGGM